jgi:hypothetical protein
MSRTDNQPDELTDDSPNLPGGGQQTYAWIAECTDDLDAPESVSLADDDTSLTAADIKMIRNTVISAISHNADVAAWFAAGMRAVLADAGVLTGANFAAQLRGPFDGWLRDRVYEAEADAVRDGWLAPGAKPPPPKAH